MNTLYLDLLYFGIGIDSFPRIFFPPVAFLFSTEIFTLNHGKPFNLALA
jgi:hypothetical protein